MVQIYIFYFIIFMSFSNYLNITVLFYIVLTQLSSKNVDSLALLSVSKC